MYPRILCIVSRTVIQIAVNVYNDLEVGEEVVIWVPGIVYFATEMAAVQVELNVAAKTNENPSTNTNASTKEQNNEQE